ncbi:winged helix-turn-helix domain-containing protein [Streptomyces sp. NPDC056534]|uniref:helix-turn-helix domain-containing protein n=1 Tax=Streptomyces sp. NPDC056534 TaxID=3345857 RepID=UPI0036B47444
MHRFIASPIAWSSTSDVDSVSGATRLMHRLGFSPRVPARRVAARDERAVTAWKVVTWADVEGSGRPAGCLCCPPTHLT